MAQLWMRKHRDVIMAWLTTLKNEGRGLSSWETNFIREFREHMEHNPRYNWTQAQEDKLEQIYAERTPL